MVTKVDIPGHGAHMAVGFSEDGIHWGELIPWPEYNPQADSHNFPFWNEEEQCYMFGFPHMERRNPCDDHQSQPGFYPLE